MSHEKPPFRIAKERGKTADGWCGTGAGRVNASGKIFDILDVRERRGPEPGRGDRSHVDIQAVTQEIGLAVKPIRGKGNTHSQKPSTVVRIEGLTEGLFPHAIACGSVEALPTKDDGRSCGAFHTR